MDTQALMSVSQPQQQASGSTQAANAFTIALLREPLLNACISALDTEGQPGSGLKVLRLISKQIKKMMHRVIKGYRVVLDGITGERPSHPLALYGHGLPRDCPDDDYIRNLHTIKLTRLRIMVKASE